VSAHDHGAGNSQIIPACSGGFQMVDIEKMRKRGVTISKHDNPRDPEVVPEAFLG